MKNFLLAAATVLGLVASGQAHANLLVNGDFSSGSTVGWTTTDRVHYVNGQGFHEGAGAPPDNLSQSFADTAGELLTVSYDYNSPGGIGTFEEVAFNGVELPGTLISGASAQATYVYDLGIATGSDTVTFIGRNDLSYNILANISVTGTAVPEPASMVLLGAGLAVAGLVRCRKPT